jgi:hypothetical protein
MCLLHTAYEHAAYLPIVTLVLFIPEKRLSCCTDWPDKLSHTNSGRVESLEKWCSGIGVISED